MLSSPLLFRDALQASAAATLIIRNAGPRQTIVYSNPAFERLSGYTAQELSGRDWSFLCAGSDAYGALEALRSAVFTGRGESRTVKSASKQGVHLWLEIVVSPAINAGEVSVLTVHDVTQARLERERLEHRAYHDALTGLPNRYLLQDRFEMAASRARRYGESFGVAFIDLNGFKLINDSFGHECGDEILRQTGRRLASVVRDYDTAARLGGDEFVLLLQGGDEDDAASTVNRIVAELRQPLHVSGNELTVSCSVGLTYYPDDGIALCDLLRRADSAMYATKQRIYRRLPVFATAM